ncbi:N-acetyltransferase family protein [Brucellaceae bacterium C25G]
MSNSDKDNKTSNVNIRPLSANDASSWRKLYKAYADFYHVPMSDEILDQTWIWLLDRAHPLEALVATQTDGVLVGLAHYRPFPKPLLGKDAGFLDDLFVNPDQRGSGIGRALLNGLKEIARERGWPLVRWITAQDNAVARQLYDDVATSTTWVTYDLKP